MNKLDELCDKVLRKTKADSWYIDPNTLNALNKLAKCSKVMYAALNKVSEDVSKEVDAVHIMYDTDETICAVDAICGED
jgi:hypothetical protein